MPVIFANNAVSLLAASINASATSLSISADDAARFPTPTGGDWFPLTLFDEAGAMEIMRCTARASAVLTVVRGQEGTAAVSWSAGAGVELRATAASMAALSAPGAASIAFAPAGSIAATNVQAAIEELDGAAAAKADLTGAEFTGPISGTEADFTGTVAASDGTAPEHVMPRSQSDVRYKFRANARQDVATASTVNLAAITATDYINLTGTIQIDSFGTGGAVGSRYVCRADAGFVINQGTNLQTPTGADITTEPGDLFEVVLEGSNVRRIVAYLRATGRPLAGELSAADKIKLDALSTASPSNQYALYTSSGSWTPPAGVTRVRVTVAGGGGGGGNDGGLGGASGGGGGIARGDYTVTPGTPVTVTVGAGGAATAGGGSSSFGAFLSATGGTAGVFATPGTNGAGTGGNITNSTAANRNPVVVEPFTQAVAGRNSGSGAAAVAFNAQGPAGYGVSGGGAASGGTPAAAGGVGGMVLIQWIA